MGMNNIMALYELGQEEQSGIIGYDCPCQSFLPSRYKNWDRAQILQQWLISSDVTLLYYTILFSAGYPQGVCSALWLSAVHLGAVQCRGHCSALHFSSAQFRDHEPSLSYRTLDCISFPCSHFIYSTHYTGHTAHWTLCTAYFCCTLNLTLHIEN